MSHTDPRANGVNVNRIFTWAFVCLFAFLYSCPGFAEISLNKTRLIITEAEKEGNLRILNEGKTPVLIQVWVDQGNASEAPEKIKVPFVVTSPMFRLDSGTAQRIRILFTGDSSSLSGTSESVFWLNIQEIPSKTLRDEDGNKIQIAFRTRIKVFYRPKPIPAQTDDFHRSIRFRLTSEGAESQLWAENPSPIHVTLLHLSLIGEQGEVLAPRIALEQGMVTPEGSLQIPLGNLSEKAKNSLAIVFTYLNDFGDPEKMQFTLPQ